MKYLTRKELVFDALNLFGWGFNLIIFVVFGTWWNFVAAVLVTFLFIGILSTQAELIPDQKTKQFKVRAWGKGFCVNSLPRRGLRPTIS